MKVTLLFIACLSLLLTTCSTSRKSSQTGTLHIFVSIPPQKYFVEQIGGEHVSVTAMIPPGASPHTFEPKPAQMASLAAADCYFTIGLELEDAWLPRLGADKSACTIIATDSGIARMMMDESDGEAAAEHDDAHHTHEGADPHIWLSPSLVKIQAATITAALCRLDTLHSAYYRQREALFISQCDSISTRISRMIGSCAAKREFLVFHPSWGYFAREFSLRQIAIEVEGKEPSLREMKMILDTASTYHITTIFIQPQFSRKIAETIALQLGGTVAVADPMAGNWSENLLSFAGALCR